jgi:hypothetical protein
MSFGKLSCGALLFLSTAALAQPPKPNWHKIEADNGAITQIDLNSIRPFANGREAIIYIDQGGSANIANMKRIYFDCRGHMTDISGGMSAAVYVAPRSVGGRLAAIVCKK